VQVFITVLEPATLYTPATHTALTYDPDVGVEQSVRNAEAVTSSVRKFLVQGVLNFPAGTDEMVEGHNTYCCFPNSSEP